jgi:uncharacterized protein
MRDIAVFLDAVKIWAASRPDILAILIVGSHARGTARPDSDVDLVIISDTPAYYLGSDQWLSTFGSVTQIQDEDWGLLQSRRTFYDDGLEVEFGITTREWAATNPVDEGTHNVVADGAQIVLDPSGLLAQLIGAVEAGKK